MYVYVFICILYIYICIYVFIYLFLYVYACWQKSCSRVVRRITHVVSDQWKDCMDHERDPLVVLLRMQKTLVMNLRQLGIRKKWFGFQIEVVKSCSAWSSKKHLWGSPPSLSKNSNMKLVIFELFHRIYCASLRFISHAFAELRWPSGFPALLIRSCPLPCFARHASIDIAKLPWSPLYKKVVMDAYFGTFQSTTSSPRLYVVAIKRRLEQA